MLSYEHFLRAITAAILQRGDCPSWHRVEEIVQNEKEFRTIAEDVGVDGAIRAQIAG